jgi:hypothetical protein
MTPNQPNPNDDLDWLAFLYANGELSAEDAVAFETRLSEDLAACEALARAARIHDVLVGAGQPLLAPDRAARSVTIKRGAMLLALAAALLIAVGIWQLSQSASRSSRLAVAWSDLVVGLTANDDDPNPAIDDDVDEAFGSEAFDPTDNTHRTETEASNSDEVPDWLIAAVEYEGEARNMHSMEQAPEVLIPERALEN